MTRRRWLGIGSAVAALTGTALAEPSERPLRLIGEAPSAQDPAPRAFAIDAVVKPGDGDMQSTLSGWFAATQAPAASGEISGSCVETHCAVSIDLDGSKLTISGDFGEGAATSARYTLKDDENKVVQQGAASVRPLDGPIPGLGALAPPGAIKAAAFDDLLMWNHESVSSGSPPGDDPLGGNQWEPLATWQQEKGRLATGLLFATDLAELKADAEAARKAAGWLVIGVADHGWSAGYPAALLPKASRNGAEQQFSSADGKAALTVAIDPPMTSEAFDAFVETTTADRGGRGSVSTVRVNSDLEMRFEEGGRITVAAYHNREGGLARLVFTYPAALEDTYLPFDVILQRSLVVTDELRR